MVPACQSGLCSGNKAEDRQGLWRIYHEADPQIDAKWLPCAWCWGKIGMLWLARIQMRRIQAETHSPSGVRCDSGRNISLRQGMSLLAPNLWIADKRLDVF